MGDRSGDFGGQRIGSSILFVVIMTSFQNRYEIKKNSMTALPLMSEIYSVNFGSPCTMLNVGGQNVSKFSIIKET